jgi:acetyl-CoA synthetase
MTAIDNFAHSCCGRWAEDRARFALYGSGAGGADSAWSFWDVQREANRFSNVLAALGVMRGERVALLLGQRADTAAAHVACYQMGAVAAPLSRRLDAASLQRGLAAAQARVAIVDAAGQAALAALPAAHRPRHVIGVDGAAAEWLREWAPLRALASPRYVALTGLGAAPALLLGAGSAREMLWSHAALAGCAQAFVAAHAGYPQPGDLFWSPADWATAAGLLDGLLAAWSHGQPVVACDGDLSPAATLALIAKYDVRNTRLTPAELEALRAAVPKPNDQHDCHLRTLAIAGTPESPLAAWLQTELGSAGTVVPAEESES